MLKLHLGCGPNILPGYTNVDKFVEHPDVLSHDILNLPFDDQSVDEILSEHMLEHLSFEEEKKFWYECHRVLAPNGVLKIETPDFEWLCQKFLEADESEFEFYETGSIDHYFGNGRSTDHRWGMLTTHFFGNQNGPGQFHKTAYTENKYRLIAKLLGFKHCEILKVQNKGAQALVVTLTK